MTFRKTKLVIHVASKGKMGYVYKFFVESFKGRELGRPRLRTIILETIL
jgi:hypothetical protein